MTALSDFHILYFIFESGLLDTSTLQLIFDIVKTKSEEKSRQLVELEAWQTFLMILKESASELEALPLSHANDSQTRLNPTPQSQPWACRHCTFMNMTGVDQCEMCGLPDQ